jgi:hypothetical protein
MNSEIQKKADLDKYLIIALIIGLVVYLIIFY